MASSSSGKRPSDAEWLKHKLTIERMFVDEKKSLLETRQRLETDGFLVTKAQLEYKLKLWGLRRRIPKTKSDAVWQFIGRRVQRRKQQGKETEVVLGTQIFNAAKVFKEIKRYQETTIARFNQPSPTTPEGLEVSLNTPAPLPMRFVWPASMPWNRFQDSFPLAFSGPGLFKNMNSISKELTYRKEDPSFATMLRVIAPQYAAGSSITQLAAEIGSIMPEAHENENFGRASRLLQGTTDERYSEYVKIILYKISNNLFSVDMRSHTEWENITDILETSDIMKAPLQLGSITDATMAAIMEKLFQLALSNMDWELSSNSLDQFSNGRIINWLLQSGQNPDIRIKYYVRHRFDYSVGTPLQLAARMGSLQLMSRLLDHGACPDLSYEPRDQFNESRAVNSSHPLPQIVRHYDGFDEGRLGMIERLLKTSSEASRYSVITIMMSCGRYFPELMEAVVSSGADMFRSIKIRTNYAWFIDTFSIIGCTVKYSCEPKEFHPFFRLLEDAGIQNRSQIPKAVSTTSIVLLAAAEGNSAFLEDLHSYGIDTTAPGNLGISAIHVAAYYGHLETCKTLVVQASESNKQIPFPLHFAVAGGRLGIIHSLPQSKIDVNEVFEDEQEAWSAVWKWEMEGRQAKWLDCSFTALDVALEFNRLDIARYLLENGAKAPPWGAYAVTCNCKDDETQELAKLALKAGADPSWGVCIPSSTCSISICYQFRQALAHGHILLAQQLVLDAHEDNLWNDPFLSILEAAIITCHKQTVETIFAHNPGAYDPGALCAKVLFSTTSRDSITINRLLSYRPQSAKTSSLEALAIGLAAWTGQMEVLKLLLGAFDQLTLVKVPHVLTYGLRRFSPDELSTDGRLPFWHETFSHQCLNFISTSPILFALGSREALSLMLNHGYKPDRLTMRAAINDFDRDILKTLMKSPRRLNWPNYIEGPLSYAVRYRKYDVVRFLLENGEDVNENNHDIHAFGEHFIGSARSPLQAAVENSDLQLIDLLLNAGADVNTPAPRLNGATALQLAAIAGRLGILRTLIDHGADVNAPGAQSGGRTALEGAAEHGRIDMIQYLLSIGARTTGRDRLQYLRAIRFAEMEAHEVAANLLRGHREWTTDDQDVWTALKGLDRWQLEIFQEKTQEVPSSLNLLGDNMALEDNEVEDTSTKDSSDHLEPEEDVYDPTEAMEPPDHLQDLEMRTNDPMVFILGEM